jgi:hypothetical protein
MQHPLIPLFSLILLTGSLPAQPSQDNDKYKLVYEQDFEDPGALDDFEMSDSEAWKIVKTDDSQALELFGASKYEARVRSPFNIAMVKDLMLGDFVMEVDLAQTGREYGHRDLCLFFAMKDPTNFYYVHMASVADDHANNIFLVNDEPRIKIASKTSTGTDWGETGSWHRVRLERMMSDGLILVYFDDMENPIMEANDTHFDFGHVGFGSFDDTGMFDNIKIWAPVTHTPRKGFFK